MSKFYFPLIILLILAGTASGQEIPVNEIKEQIAKYKVDRRGPYYRIKWFCDDGSIREPRDPCPDSIGGGIQHASYKDDVKELANRHHIFFGEILAHANKEDFWDEKNNQNRLKQYQLGKYLASVDDGWILRKGQYYRGAVQSEDEEEWGVDFYQWLLKDDIHLKKHYFLIRQSLRDIPHDGDNNLAQQMRSQSKIIAEEFPDFMDVRIKIHGKPDKTDIQLVTNFRKKYDSKLSNELKRDFSKLTQTLQNFYAPIDSEELKKQVSKISSDSEIKKQLFSFLSEYDKSVSNATSVQKIADILCTIRENITRNTTGSDRLIILDLSNELENILLKRTQEWKPEQLKELLQKIYALSYAASGTGMIELWEWQRVQPILQSYLSKNELTINELNDFLTAARSIVEWSAAMAKANYQDVVNTYTLFEPKAYGFIDDRIRSSVALDLGESVSVLGSFLAKESSLTNTVMQLENQSTIRGLNPGYAHGTLVVVEGSSEDIEVDTEKIYIFQKPPSDLKPVAGIMTVSEGNLVSHVQLLARNLGIPNAALSDKNLKALLKFNGQKVFYAVSDKGNVILKVEKDMTPEERALFSEDIRNDIKITVPTDQIQLEQTNILNMAEIDANDSGKLCGPKAANLGQLKAMFPDHVVEGLVIPFGIFRNHMDQKMPNTSSSYWDFLRNTFVEAEKMRANKISHIEIEKFQLENLKVLKNAIKQMDLKDEFISDLRIKFKNIFGSSVGSVPVFLRSDTNMEDLEEFTGAGLNLTLFNIVSEDKIIQGIKDVWASPYTERSFKWRQQYLLNPENVFPSILIIPSVDVDYSGVLITKGINVGNENDLTVAFSRGAGGAVDGQSAETRLITPSSNRLLAPARQPDFIRLPTNGGTSENTTTFESPILNSKNIDDIRQMAGSIRETLAKKTDSKYKGAYDVELGFEDDKLWLFQIRPFVENKKAKSSTYLTSITPTINYDKKIMLTAKL